MRLQVLAIASLLYLAALLASAARAESPSQLLEKGIYNEETVGNLDEAIKFYRAVVADAKETQIIAAQAQYRLGLCLLKQGKTEEAHAALQEVVSRFPEQTELVAKARKQLPAPVDLQAAPWETGERLTLTMKLASGLPIRIVGLGVDAHQHGDRTTWRMFARRFVTGGQNQGASQMIVDRTTNRPIFETWEHTLLGNSTAGWEDDKIMITVPAQGNEPAKTTTVTYNPPAYSNDQMFFAFRQLPLAVGYKVTVPLRITFTGGNAIDLTVNVTQKETIETICGTFECFKLETNIAQTFWIADVPQRYLVRFDAQGVTAELTSIGTGQATTIRGDEHGFSVTVPPGWFHYDASPPNRKNSDGTVMVAPELHFATLRVQSSSRLSAQERESPRAWADSKIKEAEELFKGLQVQGDGPQDTTFGGMPAVSFSLEYEVDGRPLVVSVLLAIKGDKAIELTFSTPKSQVEMSRDAFRSIRESVTVN